MTLVQYYFRREVVGRAAYGPRVPPWDHFRQPEIHYLDVSLL